MVKTAVIPALPEMNGMTPPLISTLFIGAKKPGKGKETSFQGASLFIFVSNTYIFQMKIMRLQRHTGFPRPQALDLQARLSDSTTLTAPGNRRSGEILWGFSTSSKVFDGA